MKCFKFLLVAIWMTYTSISFAQNSVKPWHGLRFGYDMTTANIDVDDADNNVLNGFTAGYVHAFNIAKLPLFFETGLGISFVHYDEEEYIDNDEYKITCNESLNMVALRVPLNMVCRVQCSDKVAFKPFVGFYWRANLFGKEVVKLEYGGERRNLEYNVFSKHDMGGGGATWKRIQFGWQAGFTMDINKFNVGIGYAIVFNEVAKRTKCGIFSANLGVNF